MACSVVSTSSSHRGQSPGSRRCQFGWPRKQEAANFIGKRHVAAWGGGVKMAESFVEGENGKLSLGLCQTWRSRPWIRERRCGYDHGN